MTQPSGIVAPREPPREPARARRHRIAIALAALVAPASALASGSQLDACNAACLLDTRRETMIAMLPMVERDALVSGARTMDVGLSLGLSGNLDIGQRLSACAQVLRKDRLAPATRRGARGAGRRRAVVAKPVLRNEVHRIAGLMRSAPVSGKPGDRSAVGYVSHVEIENLIARVALGDRDAFSRLYDAVAPKLLGVALRVLEDRASAEDAMQDAFVKIWRNADRYAVTGHSPMTWLIAIARNTAIDRLRRRRPVDDIDALAEVLPAVGACGEAAAMARSEVARITACLDELDPDRRDAVRGAYLDGRSYADLAAQHGVPLNTMRTWLRRSLLRLRECMSR